MKERVQKIGRYLSGMVMPNIGAFIAWGIITALFIPTGWIPNEKLGEMVGPMITYLLPLLVGFTGGRAIGGVRGGVVGAIATIGVIMGADVPMFLGAMLVGPLGGWLIKKVDDALNDKIPAGFEMLVTNFTAGILGAIVAIIAFLGIGPIAAGINSAMGAGVNWLVEQGLLPLTSILVEPAKVLFLNNAINHGVFTPMGAQQVSEIGKSIFFMIESNPGPGLGLLLAYTLFGKGNAKSSAPGAIIIHFLGGIHEIYFPYVLMNPVLILAMIGGGMSGVLVLSLFGGGLVGAASPGSIFAELMMTPKGAHFANIMGILIGAVVSFALSAILIKIFAKETDDLAESQSRVKAMKAQSKGVLTQMNDVNSISDFSLVRQIIFACDAGMGSSAMGATALRKKIKAAGLNDIQVTHSAIDMIPTDAQIIVTHKELMARARAASQNARIITITNFMNTPEYDVLVEELVSAKKSGSGI